MKTWTQAEAIALCAAIEQFAPARRDCDIVLYRHDKNQPVNWDGMQRSLATLGIIPGENMPGYGYYHRMWQGERKVDFLCKEEDGEYPQADPADKQTTSDLLR